MILLAFVGAVYVIYTVVTNDIFKSKKQEKS